MKRVSGIVRSCLLALGVFFLMFALNSCSKDEPMDNVPDSGDTTDQTDGGDTTTSTSLEAVDVTLLTQVKKASDTYDMNQIWNGYNFSSMPMYYVYVDENNKPLRGYLVNPKSEFTGATKIEGNDALGLNLYRFDKDITTAIAKLNEGNGEFEFYFEIEGKKHYLQKYSDKSVADIVNPAVTLAAHEMFHIYQFADWTSTLNTLQDEANYPITKELLEMQILLTHIGKKMPSETDVAAVKKYLKMYVAIRTNEITLDPTPEKFVINMANEQEKGEGTARYVDNMLGDKVVTDFEIIFSDPDHYNDLDKIEDVRSEFAFGIWYGTGAAVTYMLKNQGIAIENDIKIGKTLYDIAEEKLNLTAAEKATALQQAKDEFDWAAIQELAQKLANL